MTENIPYTPNAIAGCYGANIYMRRSGEEEQRLQCMAQIIYCGEYMKKFSIYKLTKSEYFVNKNQTDLYVYDMARRSAAAIYPLTILVNTEGKMLGLRTDDILKRWEIARPQLEEYYKEEFAKSYFDSVEQTITDKENVKSLFNNDLIFTLIFGIEYNQPFDENTEFSTNAKLIGTSDAINFTVRQQISSCDYKTKLFNVVRNGIAARKYMAKDIFINSLNDTTPLIIEFTATYEMCLHTYEINSIESVFTIKTADKTMLETQINIYRQPDIAVEQQIDDDMKRAERRKKIENNKILDFFYELFK